MEESGRHYVGKLKKQLKGSVGSLHGTSLYIRVGNTGTDREPGGEDADNRGTWRALTMEVEEATK